MTLTTDFGLADAYVASMKGVALGIVPDVDLIDITHAVPPRDVSRAAYILASACPYFPAHAVHLAVVDPGVGTSRKPIAVSTPHGTFVGPDNGIFHEVLVGQGIIEPDTGIVIAGNAIELTGERYRRQHVSATFHGRDIFAPAAAYLALGVSLMDLGRRLSTLTPLCLPQPQVAAGVVRGHVRHIDTFGNAITNIHRDLLPSTPAIFGASIRIDGLSKNYQEREISALVGSTGYLEIAIRGGSAHERLGIELGDEVLVRGDG